MEWILIIVGFVLLIKGADLLVDGASSIAKRFKVSDLVIGLTIVALGTSAPELVVCIISALDGDSGIAIGNVIGSNIANICLVLAGAGLLKPIVITKKSVWGDIPFCLVTALCLLAVIFLNTEDTLVSRLEGTLLLGGLLAYIVFMLKSGKDIPIEDEEETSYGLTKSSLMLILGLLGLVFGGDMIVKNAVSIAERMNVSQEMIGLTIVALGTSLPELATAIVAVRKNKFDIAVGNVIGSNILNTFLVLGGASVIAPIAKTKDFLSDALLLTAVSAILFVFMFTGEKKGSHKLDRWEAIILISIYVGYIAFVIHRR